MRAIEFPAFLKVESMNQMQQWNLQIASFHINSKKFWGRSQCLHVKQSLQMIPTKTPRAESLHPLQEFTSFGSGDKLKNIQITENQEQRIELPCVERENKLSFPLKFTEYAIFVKFEKELEINSIILFRGKRDFGKIWVD